MVTEEQVIEKLKQCIDPEIPVDIWNLGLIYDIQVNESTVTKGGSLRSEYERHSRGTDAMELLFVRLALHHGTLS